MSELQLTQGFRHVALAAIEAEFDSLWREASESALAAGGAAVGRNTVLTLVAHTPTAALARQALDAIEQLTAQHPARAIVLLPRPESPSATIDAYVAIHREGAGPALSYGEEIVIEACGDAANHTPGVVLPLMVSGLPAFLWWTGEPPWETALVETLADGCDRFIIDSSEASDAERMLGAAADLVRRKHEHCALSDFNWTRQGPWRELTAQFFDSPGLGPYLGSVDRVTVECAAGDEEGPANFAQAYLFVGWLASRLGWSLPLGHRRGYGPSRQHTLHDENGRPVLVEVNARHGLPVVPWSQIDATLRRRASPASDGAVAGELDGHAGGAAAWDAPRRLIGDGALMSVRLHALANRRPATFVIARDQDMQHATTLCQVDAGAPPSHTVHLPSLGETSLLNSQLELLGHDAIYEEALGTAARLVGHDVARRLAP